MREKIFTKAKINGENGITVIALILTIIIVSILTTIIIFSYSKTHEKNEQDSNLSAKMQIIKRHTFYYSDEIVEQFTVKNNSKIKLDSYNDITNYKGNDIKIMEVKDEYVMISRKAIKYKTIKQKSQYDGSPIKYKKYKEEVIQSVLYGEEISIDINERAPFAPLYERPEYYYYIKFVK